MAGHSFFDDNTGRFYPFNEEKLQERRTEFSEQLVTLLKRGIADTGIVVASGRTLIGAVYGKLYRITKVSDYYEVCFNISTITLKFSWTPEALQTPFTTIKAETTDGETFGYFILGHRELWDNLPDPFVWNYGSESGIELQRSRISWLDQRQITHVTPWNTERLRATNSEGCPPIQWPEGSTLPEGSLRPVGTTITDQPIVFREGFNCSITTSPDTNRLVIQPIAGAGKGVVSEDLSRGIGEQKPGTLNRSRYDGALEYGECAYHINEAAGPIVNIYTSHHFKVTSSGNVVTIKLISAGRYTDLCK
jgi:hypothetical protein